MAKIRDIQLIPLEYRLPEPQAYGMARGLTAVRQTALIQVFTDEGVTGIGEAWGPCEVTAAYLELIKQYYLNRSVFDQEQIWSLILNKHYHLGIQNQMVACLSGIDIALYDAIGKLLDLPVYQLLGGKARDRVPVYASGGYLTHDPDNQLDAQLHRLQDQGFTAAKIKIGVSPDSDESRVKLAREILADDTLLLVDVNGNYTVDIALESMQRTADYDVHCYEEPLTPQDFAGYQRLRELTPTKIATGEALYTVHDFKRLLDCHGVDLVQPDLTLCGGLTQGKYIAMLCQLYNLRLSPHVWGSAVGLAAAVHFVASLPATPHTDNIPYPALVEYDVGKNGLRDELLQEPLIYADSHLTVPNKPGLGIELNGTSLQRFRLK